MGAGPGAGRSLYNAAVAQRQITTTEDQSATFIELFFDLVFVYAVTQTVSLLHEICPGPDSGMRWSSSGWCGGPGRSTPGH